MVIQGVYTIITPLSMILLARFLGPKDFGEFGFAVSFVIIASIFAGLGFPIVVTRFGAIYYIKEEWKKLKGIFRFSNKVTFVSSLAIIAIVCLVILSDFFELPSKKHVLIALPVILFLSLSKVRTALLTAIEKVNIAQLPEMIIRPILFFLIVLILYYYNILDGYSSIISYAFANGIIFLIGAVLVNRYTSNYLKNEKCDYETTIWKNSATPLFLLGSVQVLGAQADILLLGFLANSSEVGVFKSMYQISLLIIFSLTAANAVSAPYIVRSYENKNDSQLKRLLFTFCGINFLFAILIALPFLLFGEYLIILLYGQEFVIGLGCLYILIVGRVINSIFGISNQFLKMMGEERKAAKGIILGTIVGVFLNIVLIPEYGIIGAAIASSVGMITWNIYLFLVLLRKIYIKGI